MTALDPGLESTDWSGLIVVCAGKSWDSPWGGEKHLATRLTRYAPVLFVDPAVSWLTPLRTGKPMRTGERRLRLVAPRLARLTPLAPPGVSRPGLRELARLSTRAAMGRAVRQLAGRADTVIVASLDDMFGACGEQRRVLLGTDDFVAGAALMGIDESWLRQREARQLRLATDVVAISPSLAENWAKTRAGIVMIPNGVDAAAYLRTDDLAPAPGVMLPAPIAGFIGHLSDRIDVAIMDEVIATGCSVLLVGPASHTFGADRLDRLRSRPNVQWVGPQPFEKLPSYMRHLSVGITPYANVPFNQQSFPLKTLEYLAAGRAAVATGLPSVTWLDTDLVTVADTPAEFADAVVSALGHEMQPDEKRSRQEFAARHSWDLRVETFARMLGLATPAGVDTDAPPR